MVARKFNNTVCIYFYSLTKNVFTVFGHSSFYRFENENKLFRYDIKTKRNAIIYRFIYLYFSTIQKRHSCVPSTSKV